MFTGGNEIIHEKLGQYSGEYKFFITVAQSAVYLNLIYDDYLASKPTLGIECLSHNDEYAEWIWNTSKKIDLESLYKAEVWFVSDKHRDKDKYIKELKHRVKDMIKRFDLTFDPESEELNLD